MFGTVPISKYALVAATLIAAGFGFPIPEEIPIVTAGVMVGHDAQEALHTEMAGAIAGGPGAYLTPERTKLTRWWIMLPVCIIAVVIGDATLYTIGRLGGTRLLANGWVQRHVLPPDRQAKIIENFHKNGIMILLGARMTPGIRSPVFIMAGVLRMPLQRFLFADLLYAIPGVTLLFTLAYWFTDQFLEGIRRVEQYRPIVIAMVLAAIAGVVLYKLLTSRKVSTGDLSQIPDLAKPVAAVTNAVERAAERTVGKTAHATANVLDKVRHPGRHAEAKNPHPDPAPPPTTDPATKP